MQCSKVKRMAVDEYIREQQKIKKAKRISDEFEKILKQEMNKNDKN